MFFLVYHISLEFFSLFKVSPISPVFEGEYFFGTLARVSPSFPAQSLSLMSKIFIHSFIFQACFEALRIYTVRPSTNYTF